ncbi:protease complex subunit PrcB family protein [Hyalangium rubrum]|uniref:Protease complex subunit PrcB family protein n=1 Tax=Hyalangium rubrum TaxID=3103134 RepID=A0ABU5GZK3_9BACT|nr:protease complex subunit PrcB family protein [Hyalangium sp. s54d21]MDY7226312.1 protease complex subunit PrcB family protein [Hyalangium sp. s54d21]
MSEAQAQNTAFSEVFRDGLNGSDKPEHHVLSSREEYEAWFEHARRRYPPSAAEVDFAQEVVLVVSAGRKSTTGHDIQVVRVVDLSGVLGAPVTCVLYRETSPSAQSGAGDALTYPVHMVKVPRRDTQYVFARG